MSKFTVKSIFCVFLFCCFFVINCSSADAVETHKNGWIYPAGTSYIGGYSGWHGYPRTDYPYHVGQDYNLKKDSPVYSIADGGKIVKYSSSLGFYGNACGKDGGAILVKYSNSKSEVFYALYGHVYIKSGLAVGDPVNSKDIIGYVHDYWGKNNAGACTEYWPHLHFGIHPGSEPTNPWSRGVGTAGNDYGWVNPIGAAPTPISYLDSHYPDGGTTGKPDLVVKEVNLSKTTLAPGESFHIDTRIKNDGDADVQDSFHIKYLLSNGTGIDSSPDTLAEDSISSLGKGDSTWEDATVNAPTTPGTYNITVKADSDSPDDIDESKEGNNYFDPPVVITVAISNAIPEGSFDAADCSSIRGWTRDPDTTNPINVHIYADGPSGSGTFIGQVLADGYRGDLPFSDKNHGFDYQLPSGLKNGLNHSIYAYAIDSAGGQNPLLNGSPKNILCDPVIPINPAVMSIIIDLILNGDDSKPVISVTPSSLDLGNVNIGQSSTLQTITVKNAGDAALNIGTLSMSSTAFTLQNDLCSGKALAVAATCTSQVIFTPSQAGLMDEKINIPTNDPVNPIVYVALKGNGVVGIPAPPSNLIAAPGNNAVGLTWTASNEAELSGYKIYYGTSPGSYGIPLLTGKVNAFTVTGLTNGTTYYIAISAMNTVGAESAKTAEVSGTPLLDPTDTIAPTITNFRVTARQGIPTVAIALIATDNIGGTGVADYCIQETNSYAGGTWSGTVPTQYTFSTIGNKILYAWARDVAGNVSPTASVSITITLLDTAAPTVTAFTLPATASDLTVPVSSLDATDAVGVTGYLLSKTASQPQANDPAWSATVPASYTFTTQGAKTLYAFAKDAAGNVSAPLSASVTISLPDTTAPTVTAFTIPATSTSLTVPVSSLTATDSVAVTGYLFSETSTIPSVTDIHWTTTPTSSYTFANSGAKTLYAWAKDAAGNVSAAAAAAVTITLPDTIAPTVNQFSIPTTATSLTIAVTALTATDDVAVTGFMLSESATPPQPDNPAWTSTPPTSYTLAAQGSRTVYAFAKDATGNISAPLSTTITITLSDTTAPTVTAFALQAAATSLTVPVSVFTATDNVAVTGYFLSESATKPPAADPGWTSTPPAVHTFSTVGGKTLYAFARDAGGNISPPASASVVITLPVQNYTVTPVAGNNGSLSPSNAQTVNSDATTSFTVTPASGYQIATATGCGGTLTGSTYTTAPITGACIVSASFSAIPVTATHTGDVNGDNKVDISDALMALRIAVGLIPMDNKYLADGDVAPYVGVSPQPDGKIDISDALLILKKCVGLINW